MQKRTTVLFTTLIVILVVVLTLIKSNSHKLLDSSIDTPDGVVKVYLEAMIPHHQEAVDSSLKIMEDRTLDNYDLRIMAGRIYDAQTFEIVQMKSWYADWFGTPYNASSTLWKGKYMPMMTQTMAATDAKSLEGAYIKEMIAHHKMALAMSKEAQKALAHTKKTAGSSSDGTLTIMDANPIFDQANTFMQKVIDVQSTEIEQLSSLRK